MSLRNVVEFGRCGLSPYSCDMSIGRNAASHLEQRPKEFQRCLVAPTDCHRTKSGQHASVGPTARPIACSMLRCVGPKQDKIVAGSGVIGSPDRANAFEARANDRRRRPSVRHSGAVVRPAPSRVPALRRGRETRAEQDQAGTPDPQFLDQPSKTIYGIGFVFRGIGGSRSTTLSISPYSRDSSGDMKRSRSVSS
jgi:hypothetical protein